MAKADFYFNNFIKSSEIASEAAMQLNNVIVNFNCENVKKN